MNKKVLIIVFVCACLISSIAVYVIYATNSPNTSPSPTPSPSPSPTTNPTATPTPSTSPSPTPSPTPHATPTPTSYPTPPPTPTPTPTPAPTPTPSPSPTPTPSTEPHENVEDHDDPADYVWDSSAVVDITLNGDSITVNPPSGATVAGSKVTITSAGTYRITGSLTDGQIIVDTQDDGTIRLILNGIDVTCSTSAPIYVEDAKKVIIVLQEDTQNSVTDGTSYILEPDTDEPNAAIFSKADLTIFGVGSLTVNANYNDGIASKDGLIIKSGTVIVNSVDDGIRGKDYLVVKGGTITVDADGDGLKSDDDSDVARGYVSVEAGVITVTAGKDAISGQTDVIVTGGEFTLTSGGGSSAVVSASAKGLKGIISVVIDDGTFNVNSADDSIHSSLNVTINGGSFVLVTGDDGIHSDSFLGINGGTINITSRADAVEAQTDLVITGGEFALTSGGGSSAVVSASAKGLKGLVSVVIDDGTFNVNSADDAVHSNNNVTINGGTFLISTGDDGIHADSSVEINGGTINITRCFEGLESMVITINDGHIEIDSSDDGINVASGGGDDPMAPADPNQWLHINGGYIVINAVADGIDSNGYVDMSGGFLIINGPTDSFNAAIDYGQGTFKITGGTVVAVGSTGMAQGPGVTSTQYSLLINLNTQQTPRLIHLNSTSGEVFTFMPTKRFQSIVFSSPQLAPGSYSLYLGGSSTGTPTDGYYEGGTYTPGSLYRSFTITSIVTTIGGGGGFFF